MMGELWATINPKIAPGVLDNLLSFLVWCLIFELNPVQLMNGHLDRVCLGFVRGERSAITRLQRVLQDTDSIIPNLWARERG